MEVFLGYSSHASHVMLINILKVQHVDPPDETDACQDHYSQYISSFRKGFRQSKSPCPHD
ncbi:hypothetical protein RvY_09270 [Ramazzottius varieornatus]|uniref:Uncharacterized protein n=1 Tax=Ramazzottius varieornatus TaxID=947166 RepID=A0A1D1V8V2_RAMVA|nr:hypothetical protein RvY_09270 [Ramazzottius varieornatus]